MRYCYLIIALFFSEIIFAQNIKMADSLMSIGQFNNAIVEYKKSLSDNNYFKIAKAFELKGNTGEAYKNYKEYLKKDSLNLNVNYNYGLLLIELSKYTEAKKVFQQLLQTNNNPVYHYYLGISFEKLNNNSSAFSSFNKASKLDSLYFKSNYKLAVMHTNQKEFTNALEICNRFLKDDKDNSEMLKLRSQIFFVQEKFQEAIEDFNHLLLLNQEDVFIFQKLAKAYFETKQYEESVLIYSALLEKKEEAEYYLSRGICYGYLDKLKEAEVDIKKAIDLKRHTFENEYFYLGYFFQKKENFQKALEYYKKAIKQDGNHLEANYQLIVIKDYLGNSKKGTSKEYEAFLNKFPSVSTEKKQYIEARIRDLNK